MRRGSLHTAGLPGSCCHVLFEAVIFNAGDQRYACPTGKCRSTDGDRYAGAWEAGRRQGLGGCIFANGDRYQGQWAADLRHGKGACEYANGDVYQGEPSLSDSWKPKQIFKHHPVHAAITLCHFVRLNVQPMCSALSQSHDDQDLDQSRVYPPERMFAAVAIGEILLCRHRRLGGGQA